MSGDPVLLLEDHYLDPGISEGQLTGYGETEDAPTDDTYRETAHIRFGEAVGADH
jgi:hypothetical protein